MMARPGSHSGLPEPVLESMNSSSKLVERYAFLSVVASFGLATDCGIHHLIASRTPLFALHAFSAPPLRLTVLGRSETDDHHLRSRSEIGWQSWFWVCCHFWFCRRWCHDLQKGF
jgi:hypothetical protein